MCVDLKWSNFNSERIELPIWQRWLCSVASPCIAEAIHWSQPSHKVEKLLFWKSGVSTFFLCKVILKTSSVTKRLQRLCCQPTIFRLFVDILPRYDLFWWLLPEKIAFCLQLSGSKYRYFILGQTEHSSWLQKFSFWGCHSKHYNYIASIQLFSTGVLQLLFPFS